MAGFSGTKLVLTCGDAILTLLRDDFAHIPYPAHWDLPGGGAEPGETPRECGLRELAEEFGLRLQPERLADGREFEAVHPPGTRSWMFRGTLTQDDIAAIRFGDEGQAWRMMPLHRFLTHPVVVPHFPRRVTEMLGL
ncbi:NUDIX hydrolase [Paracoccus pacificus]|uniref:NUDIX hydrolase n=1 Tax=Paracoccus pacificus TaxID=1463598 RepID=A0ABW4R2V4_9RHOB